MIMPRSAAAITAAALVSLALLFAIAPKIPQPQSYHHFAGPRAPVVWSNAMFAVAGIAGLCVWRRRDGISTLVFFLGTILTAIGSSIYHLNPNDATLVYDRLGMIVAFMAFLSMLIDERYDAPPALLVSLIALGAASVIWWRLFDDLRLYGWVQFFPIVAIIILVATEKPRYTGEVPALIAVVILYAAAKLLEQYDWQTYRALGGFVSGHTLKHIVAALAPLVVAIWVALRLDVQEEVHGRDGEQDVRAPR